MPAARPAIERFREKVNFNVVAPKGVRHLGHCWIWTAWCDRHGYGGFRPTHGHLVGAHRWAYEQQHGPVDRSLDLDHLCRIPACVNPYHLEPVPHRINILRGSAPSAINARKTHCFRGHPLEGDNLRVSGARRHCRVCLRAYWNRRNARRRAAKGSA